MRVLVQLVELACAELVCAELMPRRGPCRLPALQGAARAMAAHDEAQPWGHVAQRGAHLGVTTARALLRELDPWELVACTEKMYLRPERNEPGGNSTTRCRQGRVGARAGDSLLAAHPGQPSCLLPGPWMQSTHSPGGSRRGVVPTPMMCLAAPLRESMRDAHPRALCGGALARDFARMQAHTCALCGALTLLDASVSGTPRPSKSRDCPPPPTSAPFTT